MVRKFPDRKANQENVYELCRICSSSCISTMTLQYPEQYRGEVQTAKNLAFVANSIIKSIQDNLRK